MSANTWLQIGLYFTVLLLLARPLGAYMAHVYEGEPLFLDRLLGPIERMLYRVAGIRPETEMTWQGYTIAGLVFNFAGFLAVYGLQRLQGLLPLNPEHLGAVA